MPQLIILSWRLIISYILLLLEAAPLTPIPKHLVEVGVLRRSAANLVAHKEFICL